MKQLLQLPNLLSLSRIALLWPAAHFLAGHEPSDTVWCLVIITLAGITDGLDGILARRLKQISRLGIALDPIADKIFVGGLALLAITYRDFPIWLAALVIGRDVAILLVGGLLMRGTRLSLPSNITGKYTFAALTALLFSYIIRFEFGIITMTVASVGLLVASTVLYARVMIKVKNGIDLTPPHDPLWLRRLRVLGTIGYCAVYIVIWLYQNTTIFST